MRIGRRTFATLGPLAALGLLAACSDSGNGGGGGEGGGEDDFVTDLTFGTGGTGGVYYPLGGEYAAIYEANIDGVTVNYTDSGASVENIGMIFQGEWQLGIAQSDTANAAVTGTGIGVVHRDALDVVLVDGRVLAAQRVVHPGGAAGAEGEVGDEVALPAAGAAFSASAAIAAPAVVTAGG